MMNDYIWPRFLWVWKNACLNCLNCHSLYRKMNLHVYTSMSGRFQVYDLAPSARACSLAKRQELYDLAPSSDPLCGTKLRRGWNAQIYAESAWICKRGVNKPQAVSKEILKNMYPYTINALKPWCTKDFSHGICLCNIYHTCTMYLKILKYHPLAIHKFVKKDVGIRIKL